MWLTLDGLWERVGRDGSSHDDATGRCSVAGILGIGRGAVSAVGISVCFELIKRPKRMIWNRCGFGATCEVLFCSVASR
jgi:hypothetical protein